MVRTNWGPAPDDTPDSPVKNFTVVPPRRNYLKYASKQNPVDPVYSVEII